MNFLRKIRWVLWGLVAVMGTALAMGTIYQGQRFALEPGTVTGGGKAAMGEPFELNTLDGATFTNSDVQGRPYLVFFGFTYCPDICPTTLYELTGLLAELGPAADRLVPLFITVDPARDTAEALRPYMSAFDARIVALRGTPEQTETALNAFSSYARREGEGEDYTMQHTAGVILIDATGSFAGKIDMHEPRDAQLAKLRRLTAL